MTLPPEPIRVELLSSILLRSAARRGLPGWSFTNAYLGGREFWSRDIDLNLSEASISELSASLKLDKSKIAKSTLISEARLFLGYIGRFAFVPFLMPLGIFGAQRTRFGLQYCPICLNEKPIQFWKRWRYAFVTTCEIHRVQLQDRCGGCGLPISPHRAPPARADLCWNCLHPLTGWPGSDPQVKLETPWLSKALTALVQLGLSNEHQSAEVPPNVTTCLRLYRCLIVNVVASQKNTFRAPDIIEGDEDQLQKRTFEFLPVELRHRNLQLAGELIAERQGDGSPCMDCETVDAHALKEMLAKIIKSLRTSRDREKQKIIEPRVHNQILMRLKRDKKKIYMNERARLLIDKT